MAENEQDEQGQPSGVPMTAAELAAIRERHFSAHPLHGPDGSIALDWRFVGQYIADHEALLADAMYWRGKMEQAAARIREMEDEQARLRSAVHTAQAWFDSDEQQRTERLLEQMDACWEIVRAVAAIEPWDCLWHQCDLADVPGDEHAHRSDCIVTKARAVLAEAAKTEAEE